jgi:hypothetical protein
LGNVKETLLYRETDIPVIITGSGPSLEAALPIVRQMQDNCLILAASSSVMALTSCGVNADIVITTDGGPWALKHTYPCFRGAIRGWGLAANLCAALPSQCAEMPKLIMNDGSFWQSIIFHELGLPSVIISQKGTVTAAAVELALILSGGNIYLAGTDLSVKDIRTHARPYAFDNLLTGAASRFTPVYSQSFVRSGLINEGGSLDIYAQWFKNRLNAWPKRVFSLGDRHEVFESGLPPRATGRINKSNCFKAVRVKDDPSAFCRRGADALLAALEGRPGGPLRFAENLKEELSPLLFPGETRATSWKIGKALAEIAGHYGRESHG